MFKVTEEQSKAKPTKGSQGTNADWSLTFPTESRPAPRLFLMEEHPYPSPGALQGFQSDLAALFCSIAR